DETELAVDVATNAGFQIEGTALAEPGRRLGRLRIQGEEPIAPAAEERWGRGRVTEPIGDAAAAHECGRGEPPELLSRLGLERKHVLARGDEHPPVHDERSDLDVGYPRVDRPRLLQRGDVP